MTLPAAPFPLSAPASLPAAPGRLQARRSPGRVAITYGTYDLFHIGHVNLFRRIKERFDTLIVAVSTDEFNTVKGKRCAVPFADRIEIVRACRFVDVAISECCWDQKPRDITTYGVDAFVMGSDWTGHFDALAALCEVVYLPRTDGVSSSSLKQQVSLTATAMARP